MQMQIKNKIAEWVERRPSVQNIGTLNPTMEATEVLLRLSTMTLSLLLGSSSQLMEFVILHLVHVQSSGMPSRRLQHQT